MATLKPLDMKTSLIPIAKEIGCPIPDTIEEKDVPTLVNDYLEALIDYIECIGDAYNKTLGKWDYKRDHLSLEDITAIQDRIQYFDIYKIFSAIIKALKDNKATYTAPKLKKSNISNPEQLESKLKKWITENETILSQMKSVSFSRDQLRYVSPSISCLNHLQTLNLRDNNIFDLPEEFKNLKNLNKLDLRNNQFFIVPSCLFNMQKLKKLYLNKNPLINPELYPEESLKRLKEKGIEVDINKMEEKRKEIIQNNKKFLLASFVLIGAFFALVYFQQRAERKEEEFIPDDPAENHFSSYISFIKNTLNKK